MFINLSQPNLMGKIIRPLDYVKIFCKKLYHTSHTYKFSIYAVEVIYELFLMDNLLIFSLSFC